MATQPPNPPDEVTEAPQQGPPPSPASPDDEKFVEQWMKRIRRGIKAKEEGWEKEYEIGFCKDLWRGKHYDDPLDEFQQRKVQINKVHPTVRASIPTLYFHNVFARVHASPARADTPGQPPGTSIDDKAQLVQDNANTIIRSRETGFDEATHLAVKEAHWSMGCVEIRYDAVPIENPAIEAPPLKENKDIIETPYPKRYGEFLGLSPAGIQGPRVQSERFYVRRIPARQVICSADWSGVIAENPWIGYWTIVYVEDVKKTKIYENTEELKGSAKTSEDGEKDTDKVGDKVKLFHIWAQREKMKYVFAEGHKLPLYRQKYKRRTLFPLRYDVDPDMFFPIPPIYHEIHPQLEFNDSREWLRKNRKGTVPRYTYDRDAIDPKDMKKLESGEMGTYIPRDANTHGVIEPVPQPNYQAVAQTTLALAREEFSELSMVAGERKGVPQSKTATQAKIIDVRSQTQESFDRITTAKWLAEILEGMVYLAIEKMTLKQVILRNADPYAAGFQMEAQKIAKMWQEITYQDLRDAVEGFAEWHIEIEPESMSPVAEQEEDARWSQALTYLSNPLITRMMALSDALRRKTLSLKGIKSARDQEILGETFQMMVQIEREMAMMGGAGSPGMASQPGAPPGLGSPERGAAPPPPSEGPTNGRPGAPVITGGAVRLPS